ncbi:hypothetical protein FHW83_002673 [Duganella sp. SG902]|uniref:cellulose binding domain-containing protein n=1 Tax=Duganella sp. SG902 TaxID=2587016 RepID=UPI00159D258C|nr:hypothetical protein [Duganella sp. SG902]
MTLKPICALLSAALLLAPVAQAETYKWDAIAMGGGGFVTGVVPAKSERGVFYARTDVGGAYRWDAHNERWVPLLDWLSDSRVGLLGVLSIAVDPKNAANLYVMAGTSYFNNGNSAILRSIDYGQTFSLVDVSAQFKVHGNAGGRQNGERLQVDPGDSQVLYAGTQQDGLFKSTDGGASWNRLAALPVTTTANGNGISFVLLDPASANNGAAKRLVVGVSRWPSVGANLYYSGDGGASFWEIKGGPADLMPQRAVISPDNKLYITYANGAGPSPNKDLYEMLDKGQIWEYDIVNYRWTNVTPAGVGGPFGGISMDPSNPKHLVASTSGAWMAQNDSWGDHVFTTRDAGRSWVDVVQRGFAVDTNDMDWSKNVAIHWAGDVQFDPFDTKSAWLISGNGVYRTTDLDAAPTTWRFDVKGMEETVPYQVLSLPNWGPTVTAIGDFDGFLQWDLSKYGWRHNPSMGTTTSLVSTPDARLMVRVGNDLYYSTDKGASWTQSKPPKATHGTLALSADGAVLLHSPSDKNDSTHTYRSSDYGNSWTLVDSVKLSNAMPVGDPVNPKKFYVYDNVAGRMLVSYDTGWTFWPTNAALKVGGEKRIAATPGAEGDLWVCQGDGGLLHTTDTAQSFTRIQAVNACDAVGLGVAPWGGDYPTVYIAGTVGGVRGVLRSIDRGNTWVRVNDDDHQYGGIGNARLITGDSNVFGRVYMSTVGRGVVYGQPADDGDVAVTAAGGGAALANKCDYVVTKSWQGGYTAEIRITNNRKSAVNGWSVHWRYSDNSVVGSAWNAALSGSAPEYTATANQSWNTVIAPGGTATVGISVTGSVIPTVTGDVCN